MMRRIGLVLGLAVVMALAWSAPAFAAVHSTLSLTGVTGPGPKIAPVLTLQSFSWGTSFGSGTGGYNGKGQMKTPSVSSGEFTVTVASAAALTNLMNAATSGRHFTAATLTTTRDGDAGPYLTADFTEVFVANLKVASNTSGSGKPAATITFEYSGVQLHYAAPSSDCSIGRQTWLNMSHATPAVDPITGGSAADALTEFLPLQLGVTGPGHVSVGSASQADTLLPANGTNGLSNLRAQTLAARLNIAAGGLDASSVSSQLTQADQFLGAHKPTGWGALDAATQASILNVVSQLNAANQPATGCPLVPSVATLIPPPVSSLSGLVTDACTGTPVNGLNVSVSGGGLPGPISLATGPGEYTGPTLPSGTYTLTISGNNHNPFTLTGVQIPTFQSGGTGGFTGGLMVEVAMAPPAGCAPGKNPGPVGVPAFTGGLFNQCTQAALGGGTMNLVPPAGGAIGTTAAENWFTLQALSAGSYGISENVPGYTGVTFTGGVLPAVQMPAQPSTFADGSAAKFAIIAVLEPAPELGCG